MNLPPLHLFPDDSLATSVSTTVWIGVWVVAFFNLRFGWTASGLVVPGYLVPLLFIKPLSVGVVLLEAVITYWIVYATSEFPSRTKLWCSFFGRDRFFAIVLASILVRSAMDGWALPFCGQAICRIWSINFDYQNHLHSYGLVIVSLTANYLWKPGLKHGLATICVATGITFLIVRYGLMEFTNFSICDVENMYADIASSLLASPKAYIILITTAFLASVSNLKYGWDFNGILIPALLALHWNSPLKIVASLAEASVVWTIAVSVTRLPYFNGITLEGMRKILLFFNVAFAVRILLGFIGPRWFPDVRVTDLYGFGYLLSTLIAIKAYEKKHVLKLVRSTMRVSTTGVAFGSVVGFALLSARLPDVFELQVEDRTIRNVPEENSVPAIDLIRNDRNLLFRNQLPESYRRPTEAEVQAFAKGLRFLVKYREIKQPEYLQAAIHTLNRLRFQVRRVEDRFIYIREVAPARGWGAYLFDIEQQDGLSVQVPAPLDEWGSSDVAFLLFREFKAKSLALAGCRRETNSDMSSDVLSASRSMFRTFCEEVADGQVLEVRGDCPQIQRLLHQVARKPNSSSSRSAAAGVGATFGVASRFVSKVDNNQEQSATTLWIKRAVPPDLDLSHLNALLPDFAVQWRSPGFRNQSRSNTWAGFAELTLNQEDCERLVAYSAIKRKHDRDQESSVEPSGYSGSMHHFLLAHRDRLARQGTELYQPANLEDMLYFDNLVLSPMVAISEKADSFDQLDVSTQRQLVAVATAAHAMGYQLTQLRDDLAEQDFFVLSEMAPHQKYWGTFAVKFGAHGTAVVEIPRPIAESDTFAAGAQLVDHKNVKAIAITGCHPLTNLDRSSDVTIEPNTISLFHLFRQVVLRDIKERRLVSLEIRGFAGDDNSGSIVATSDGARSLEEVSPAVRELVHTLVAGDAPLQFSNGNANTVGYEVSGVRQLLAARHLLTHEFATLWLSRHQRLRFSQIGNGGQQYRFEVAGIATMQADVAELIFDSRTPFETIPEGLVPDITDYLKTRDIVRLSRFKERWPGYQWVRAIDSSTGQAFLLTRGDNRLPILVNVGNRMRAPGEPLHSAATNKTQLRAELKSAFSVLILDDRGA
ncbi:MAG: poly-gamma-glutamate biosynthesis protein PgsC/CapC [Planctomycetales bacterium]|nr:poly-gamma-glutamate biosynthesis protein PgsC/CapC [Planctomycetales bacterium]